VIYELIGRVVVQAIQLRFRREIRIAQGVGVALAALGVAAYIASRATDEKPEP